MNVKKPVDYSAMFAALDTLVAADLPQMELYYEIGWLVNGRHEKGAAVAAAEYLHGAYPDASGFSPRNIRRMREFYRAYENASEVLAEAMAIGWTQNVVILEAELTLQERAWYIQTTRRFGWSKLELSKMIKERVHNATTLDNTADLCYSNSGEGDGDGAKETSGTFLQGQRNAEVKQELQRRGPFSLHLQSLFLLNEDIAVCHAIGQVCAVDHMAGHAIGYPIYNLSAIIYQLRIKNCSEAVEMRKQKYIGKLSYWNEHVCDYNGGWAILLFKTRTRGCCQSECRETDRGVHIKITGGAFVEESLAFIIEDLIRSRREDDWWDFKREHHHDKADLVHDITCMANSRANRDAYIIFGVEDKTFKIIGIENDANRRNQQGMALFSGTLP